MTVWAKTWGAFGLVLAVAVTNAGEARAQGPGAGADGGASALAEAERRSAEMEHLYGEGKYAQATPLAERALSLREGALGPDHPLVAQSLNNLAELYREQGAYEKAEPLLLRALRIREKALGPEHPDTATSLNNLALLYQAQGAYEKAEPLYQLALRIHEKALGPEHPLVAHSRNNLALLYQAQGAYEKAEPLFERALRIWEKALGPEHPAVAQSLHNLAALYDSQGAYAKAEPLLARAASVREHQLSAQLGVLPEPRKRHLLATLRGEAEALASFHAHDAPGDPAALRLALTVALQRKGRVLDELAAARVALRRNLTPALHAAFDALLATQTALAALREAARPEQADAVRALADEVDRRETELSRQSVAFQTQATPVTVEQVQAALPDDAALVEFVRYRRFDPKDAANPWKEWRYVAYVLRRAGPPRWAQLGEAGPIENAVRVASAALARPASDARTPLRDLDARLLAPVRRVLGGDLPKHLLVAPDADLHLVPFGALVDEGGHHLLERALVTQLGSGRDLVRLREQTAPRSGPLLVADPAFGPFGPAGSFKPLPATAAEAEAVHAVFPALVPQTDPRATKNVLAGAHGPRFVLVATHGLLGRTAALAPAASGERAPAAASGDKGAKSGGAVLASALLSPDGPDPEEALDQAALAFAGANARPDALLTARELAGVDLYGTKLVVLSACETGLGRIATGEGVYGLRRALTIAGAESQVTSLWLVQDGPTAALMGSYFGALRDGVGRSQALRQAQLGLLKQERYRHPYYWAAFVASGDWRPLDGRDPPPPVPHGGCICAIVEARPQSSAPWVLTLLPLGWLRRRKRSSVSRG